MANEIDVKRFKDSAMMLASNEVINKMKTYAEQTKVEYTDYGMTCVDSAFSKINDMLAVDGLSWNYFNTPTLITNLFNVMKYIAYMELNVANSEVAITFRNQKYNGVSTKVLETAIQGAGNDRIIKRFGENVKEIKSYLVYEGDEFTFPYIDGFEYVLPKYKPKYKSEKVAYAVYLIKLNNGEIDVSIATREDVKVSLLAHINQNQRFNNAFTTAMQEELESLSIDEILYGEWAKKSVGGKRVISPAWGDFAKERMIARKIRNHALRKWSHNLNFGRTEIANIYQEGWEEERYEKTPNVVLEHNEKEFIVHNSSVEVTEDTGKDVGVEIVEEVVELTEVKETEEPKEVIKVVEVEEKPITVEKQIQSIPKKEEELVADDIPDYLRF